MPRLIFVADDPYLVGLTRFTIFDENVTFYEDVILDRSKRVE